MLTVIYAEKPSAGRTISTALNETGSVVKHNGYNEITYKGKTTFVTWGFGHLCELKQAKDYNETYKNWSHMPLPFIPCPYEIQLKPDARNQAKIIYNLFKRADLIINATDYDREGEVIFFYIYSILKCQTPFMRAHYSSMNASSLRDAFDNLVSPTKVKDITDAGRARSIADWVVGSNLTVALTLGYTKKGVLSVGRVQTPTLKILVDREKQIRNFSKEKYFVLTGEFAAQSGETYTGEVQTRYADIASVPTPPEHGVIKELVKEKKTLAPPHLYNQSALAMAANERFGYTLQETLDASQSLYEKALTTYPRTDSQYLTEDMVPEANKVLRLIENNNTAYSSLVQGRSIPKSKYYFDDSKVDSHYAIIPTGKKPSGLNEKEDKIYDLVCKSLITTVCGAATVEKTSLKTECGGVEFVSRGSVIIEAGWLAAMGMPKEQVLPNVNKGDMVTGKYNTAERETKPPRAFTDKTILSAMLGAGKELTNEELRKVLSVETGVKGIGTEATRAAIIETLLKRQYAERKGKSIRATDMGIALIDTIPIENIKSPALTAEWEIRLDKIAKGQESLNSFLEDIHEQTKVWCEQLQKKANAGNSLAAYSEDAVGLCPKCGGQVVKRKWGWGCSNYKSDKTGCDFGISSTIAGKKLSDAAVKLLLSKGTTNAIKGFKSKSGEPFEAKIKLDGNCKTVFEFAAKKR